MFYFKSIKMYSESSLSAFKFGPAIKPFINVYYNSYYLPCVELEIHVIFISCYLWLGLDTSLLFGDINTLILLVRSQCWGHYSTYRNVHTSLSQTKQLCILQDFLFQFKLLTFCHENLPLCNLNRPNFHDFCKVNIIPVYQMINL